MLILSVLILIRICIDDSYHFEGGLHEGRRRRLYGCQALRGLLTVAVRLGHVLQLAG